MSDSFISDCGNGNFIKVNMRLIRSMPSDRIINAGVYAALSNGRTRIVEIIVARREIPPDDLLLGAVVFDHGVALETMLKTRLEFDKETLITACEYLQGYPIDGEYIAEPTTIPPNIHELFMQRGVDTNMVMSRQDMFRLAAELRKIPHTINSVDDIYNFTNKGLEGINTLSVVFYYSLLAGNKYLAEDLLLEYPSIFQHFLKNGEEFGQLFVDVLDNYSCTSLKLIFRVFVSHLTAATQEAIYELLINRIIENEARIEALEQDELVDEWEIFNITIPRISDFNATIKRILRNR
jgi:hypothetical protein